MKEIKIFKNYGCLTAEKRVIYTYGAEASTAVCSDEITVVVPDGWEIIKNTYGWDICEDPWGRRHDICDLLEGNEHPHFATYDNNGTLHRVQLDVVN